MPRWLAKVITRGLATESQHRHPSMDALVERLVQGMNAQGIAHLRANALLQLVMWPLHAMTTVYLFTATANANGGSSAPAADAGAADLPLYLVPFMVLFIVGALATVVWAPLGLVWTVVNAVGLFRSAQWGRASTIVYSALSLLTCVGTPVAIYALYSLTTRSVRDVLTHPP